MNALANHYEIHQREQNLEELTLQHIAALSDPTIISCDFGNMTDEIIQDQKTNMPPVSKRPLALSLGQAITMVFAIQTETVLVEAKIMSGYWRHSSKHRSPAEISNRDTGLHQESEQKKIKAHANSKLNVFTVALNSIVQTMQDVLQK